MTNIAPGWYPYGSTPGIVRWWDGAAWTENIRPSAPAPRPPPAAVAEPNKSDFKVSIFGARKQAKALQAKLDEVGALDLAQVEQQTQAARSELAQVREQIASAQAELDGLRRQVVDVREAASLQEVGLYDFAHPAEGLGAARRRARAGARRYQERRERPAGPNLPGQVRVLAAGRDSQIATCAAMVKSVDRAWVPDLAISWTVPAQTCRTRSREQAD